MTTFSKEAALKAYWDASPGVRQVMLAEARAMLSARQTVMVALEQRVAQAVAALFAAAAFAATFTATFRTSGTPIASLGGIATLLFTAGAFSCICGMRAGEITFPGASPSWWLDAPFLECGEIEEAEYWAVGNLELALESYHLVAVRRARFMNLGLIYGAWGGLFVALAGAVLIFS